MQRIGRQLQIRNINLYRKLVELPPGRKAITFKGFLVAKGFLQKFGVVFDETLSPVVRFTPIRALLAFSVSRNMFIHQMHIVTAFLNRTLDEDIYMEQPESYAVPGKENLVCHLKKSLYGLRQSPRCWIKSFMEFMISQGFQQSAADPCVFIRNVNGQLAIVAVHVDDLILLTETEQEMIDLKASKHQNYGRCFANEPVYEEDIKQVQVTRL